MKHIFYVPADIMLLAGEGVMQAISALVKMAFDITMVDINSLFLYNELRFLISSELSH